MAWRSCTPCRERSSQNQSDSSSVITGVELYKERARFRATGHQGPTWALPLGEMPTTNCAPQMRQRGKSTNTSSQGRNKMTPRSLRINKWVAEAGPQHLPFHPSSHDLGVNMTPARLLTPEQRDTAQYGFPHPKLSLTAKRHKHTHRQTHTHERTHPG